MSTRYLLAQQLADQVEDALATQGVSQAELAYLSGYSQKHISQCLTGKASGTLRFWDDVAFALGLVWSATL
ncbi:MAG: helix-turn-helix transcriptional regulator [Acidimicrobiales bacterium]